MKFCKTCGQEKPKSLFYHAKKNADGLSYKCIPCAKAYVADWYSRNKERAANRARAARKSNPEKFKLKKKKYREANIAAESARDRAYKKKNLKRRMEVDLVWREKNKQKVAEIKARYQRKHKETVNAYIRNRQAERLMAVPAWSLEFFVSEAYALSALRRKATGIRWNVDHIVPLKSKLVCGLHAHTNIRVIPAESNQLKGNRYWPGMPNEEQHNHQTAA